MTAYYNIITQHKVTSATKSGSSKASFPVKCAFVLVNDVEDALNTKHPLSFNQH